MGPSHEIAMFAETNMTGANLSITNFRRWVVVIGPRKRVFAQKRLRAETKS